MKYRKHDTLIYMSLI